MSTVEIMTLDGGGDPIFLAWGEHDSLAFVRAIPGMDDDAEDFAESVRFERWENVGPKHGCDEWYEPVEGEPNATVLVL